MLRNRANPMMTDATCDPCPQADTAFVKAVMMLTAGKLRSTVVIDIDNSLGLIRIRMDPPGGKNSGAVAAEAEAERIDECDLDLLYFRHSISPRLGATCTECRAVTQS